MADDGVGPAYLCEAICSRTRVTRYCVVEDLNILILYLYM